MLYVVVLLLELFDTYLMKHAFDYANMTAIGCSYRHHNKFALALFQNSLLLNVGLERDNHVKLVYFTGFDLQAVAESFTVAEFEKSVEELKNSNVWRSNQGLRNYINNEWLADDKYKVRSRLIHDFCSTFQFS